MALTALDATVAVRSGADGNRAVPMGEFYRQPGVGPGLTAVESDELVVAVTVPGSPPAARSHDLKVRERVSYEFAVVSVAAVVELDGSGAHPRPTRAGWGGAPAVAAGRRGGGAARRGDRRH